MELHHLTSEMTDGLEPRSTPMAHGKLRHRRSGPSKKGRLGITPPTSPTTPPSPSENGFYTSNLASSPRLVSASSTGEIDGHFNFLEGFSTEYPEVFTIATGSTGTSPRNSAPSARTSTAPENKYKWAEGDNTTTTDSPVKRKTRTKKICCVVLILVLVLGLLAGITVIIAFKVFNVGEQKEPVTDIRPGRQRQTDTLSVLGTLTLNDTWHEDLSNSSSALFQETAVTFIAGIDAIMADSPFNDSYVETEVISFSQGSIVPLFISKFKTKLDQATFVEHIESHVNGEAKKGTTSLKIVPDTVRFTERTTPSTTSTTSSTSSTTSTTSPTTSSTTTPTTPVTSTTSTTSPTTSPTTSTTSTSTSSSTSTTTPTTTTTSTSTSSSTSTTMPTTTTTSSTTRSTTPMTTTTTSTTPSTTVQSTTTTASSSTSTTKLTSTTTRRSTTPAQPLCDVVPEEECRRLGFTHHQYPNFFGHTDDSKAQASFETYASVVRNQVCQHSALAYFCSIHFVKCDPATGTLSYPCLSLCQEAVDSCGVFFHNPFECYYFEDTPDCVGVPPPVTTTTAPPPTCETTRHQACFGLGFNETAFPNVIGEASQTDALDTSVYFDYYIDGCNHDDIQYFFCAIQFPKCTRGITRKPCRRLCNDILRVCPEVGDLELPCDKYPDFDCDAPAQPRKVLGPAADEPSFKAKKVCAPGEFSCNEVYNCVSKDAICNGINECGDWSDEMDCNCDTEFQFQCGMGMCIQSYQQCDGTDDCPDLTDEQGCAEGCGNGQVKCKSGECIMAEWVCDGRRECSDGWDEQNCDHCKRSEFQCKNLDCINSDYRCDFKRDCADGSDEWNCIDNSSGALRIPYKKYTLPICYDTFYEDYGNYTCELLGEGIFESFGKIGAGYAFASIDGQGTSPSVLGPVSTVDCPSSMGVKLNCKPRGCGKRVLNYQNVVVNGDNAIPGNWPWHVALYFGGRYFCGGSLISHDFVITAAHCVESYSQDFRLLEVVLGANDRSKKENSQVRRRVFAILSHETHVYFKKNDIAMLLLSESVPYSNYIQPICLPDVDEELPLYSTCFTVGWGRTKWDGDYSDVLQELKMELWDLDKCNSSIAWNGDVYDTFLCAGYYSGVRSICKGDSGGPLVCLDRYNTWKLMGVSSYVANFCNKTGRPNIFSDVKKFLPWINDRKTERFTCDTGKKLYFEEQICNRKNDCGKDDDSDERRECKRDVNCNFDDKFLCGYDFQNWARAYENKNSVKLNVSGGPVTILTSYAPQFDHTVGRYPGHYFYAKKEPAGESWLKSPVFNLTTQSCVRFAYYLRGYISTGLSITLYEYTSGRTTVKTDAWDSGVSASLSDSNLDEWNTGYMDLPPGSYQISFITGDILRVAVDDVEVISGMCHNVLCKSDEFLCPSSFENKCIPQSSRCNLAVDCDDRMDETGCGASELHDYECTFENGVLCAIHQRVGDKTDFWLTNGTFVRADSFDPGFVDHTTGTEAGHVFYLTTYRLEENEHVLATQTLHLNGQQHCMSFWYIHKTDCSFTIKIECEGCATQTAAVLGTFEGWALFQLNLPAVTAVNVTYDIQGISYRDDNNHPHIILDDMLVEPGSCPSYVCSQGWTKCASSDRCVPPSALCDRKVQCMDETDETQCECTADEFRCNNGRCIAADKRCNRSVDCLDGSDEGDTCDALKTVSCDFEHPFMCGYEIVAYTSYTWWRHQGETGTPYTGPGADHTYGTPEGHYMYAEASRGGKRDNCTLVSPVFNTGRGRKLEFYYHIWSLSGGTAQPGTLLVNFTNSDTNTVTPLLRTDGLTSDYSWRNACIPLPTDEIGKITFTAWRTELSHFATDIAVDDIYVRDDECFVTSPTTPAITTPPTTTGSDGCQAGYRACDDKTCIPNNFWCDGGSDCPDSSDERDCVSTRRPSTRLP